MVRPTKGHRTATGVMTYRSSEPAFDLASGAEVCVAWVEAVVGNGPGHDETLLQWVKSGIVLCKLLNCLQPGCVPQVNEPATSEWAERENIEMFLKACQRLGLTEQQLFTVADLHSDEELRPVVVTLHWLGRLCRSLFPSAPEFDPQKMSRMTLERDEVGGVAGAAGCRSAEVMRAGAADRVERERMERESGSSPTAGVGGQRLAEERKALAREKLSREQEAEERESRERNAQSATAMERLERDRAYIPASAGERLAEEQKALAREKLSREGQEAEEGEAGERNAQSATAMERLERDRANSPAAARERIAQEELAHAREKLSREDEAAAGGARERNAHSGTAKEEEQEAQPGLSAPDAVDELDGLLATLDNLTAAVNPPLMEREERRAAPARGNAGSGCPPGIRSAMEQSATPEHIGGAGNVVRGTKGSTNSPVNPSASSSSSRAASVGSSSSGAGLASPLCQAKLTEDAPQGRGERQASASSSASSSASCTARRSPRRDDSNRVYCGCGFDFTGTEAKADGSRHLCTRCAAKEAERTRVKDKNDVPCTGCGSNIRLGHNAFDYDDSPYCKACLCAICCRPALGERWVGKDGRTFCANCTCEKCRRVVTSFVTSATGGKLCMECCCHFCRSPLGPAAIPPLCAKCRCHQCKTSLEGSFFAGPSGKRLCRLCAESAARGGTDGRAAAVGKASAALATVGAAPVICTAGSSSATSASVASSTVAAAVMSCMTCQQRVTGPYMSVGSHTYHPDCFKCVICGARAVRQMGSDGYCDSCHPDQEPCSTCGKPLQGGGVEALGRAYHEACFVCESCRAPLVGGKYKELLGAALCPGCAAAKTTFTL